MQRRVFLFVALVLCVPAMALASTITAPSGVVLSGGPGQVVNLLLSGTDNYTNGDFTGVIDAGGPLVTAIMGKNIDGSFANPPLGTLTGTIWVGGAGGIPPGGLGLTPQASLATPSNASQNTQGVYLVLTIDSTGVAPGTYNFVIDGTTLFNGFAPPTFEEQLPNDNFSLVNGSFIMPGVPEPSSVVLGMFAVAGLAAVAIRRRRTA